MINPADDILSLIPQRPPFVMIDKLIGSDEKSSRSTFLVKEENILVEDGVLGECGMVENIAQTAAARAGSIAKKENLPVLTGYIGAIKNLEVFALPQINDILETEITIDNQIFDVTLISAKVKCRDQLMAQCQMKVFIVQPNISN